MGCGPLARGRAAAVRPTSSLWGRRLWGRRLWGRRLWGRRLWGRRLWGAAVGKAAEGAAASPSTTISVDLTSSADHSTIGEIRVTEFRDCHLERSERGQWHRAVRRLAHGAHQRRGGRPQRGGSRRVAVNGRSDHGCVLRRRWQVPKGGLLAVACRCCSRCVLLGARAGSTSEVFDRTGWNHKDGLTGYS